MSTEFESITIEAEINAEISKVWQYWNAPEHITKWNTASEDWHSPYSENNLVVGGQFKTRMEAKDGSFGFDFGGTYTTIREHELIEYTLGDERKVSIKFSNSGSSTHIVETFDAEKVNSMELQKNGWQAILNNFKNYTENN